MSSFVKLVAVGLVGSLSLGVLAQTPTNDKSPAAPTAPATKEGGDPKAKAKDKDKDKKKKKKDKDVDPNAPPKAIDVPVPMGHDSKGLKIPYFGSDGKLQMNFNIGVAKRIDDNHIEMTDLAIETFDEEGQHDMAIDLPTSVMDLTTSVITTQKKVVIKRSDFELHGNTMIFNTKTRQGGVGGNVRMLIYNLSEETGDTGDAGKPKDPQPAAAPTASPANEPQPTETLPK